MQKSCCETRPLQRNDNTKCSLLNAQFAKDHGQLQFALAWSRRGQAAARGSNRLASPINWSTWPIDKCAMLLVTLLSESVTCNMQDATYENIIQYKHVCYCILQKRVGGTWKPKMGHYCQCPSH